MKIYFIGPLISTFVKRDIAILQKQHDLLLMDSPVGSGATGLIRLICKSIISILKIPTCDGIFCWFADYSTLVPALIAKLLGKKVYVVAGGFDVCYIPEMDYGARARRFRWFCVKNTFKCATKIFPVSGYAEKMLFDRFGFKLTNTSVIYNCIEYDEIRSFVLNAFRRDQILTISQTHLPLEFVLKGIDRYIGIARKLPNRKFVIAGLRGEALKMAHAQSIGIPNIEIIPGPLDFKTQLMELFLKSSAYCQLSLDESFGLAVVESMACGCMPIVSEAGALPEITNSVGRTARSDEELISAIETSFELSISDRQVFIDYARKFDISEREKVLLRECL